MKSAVAGIVKPDGGFRVVVAHRSTLKYHVAKGERLYIVPGFLVDEPVPYESQANVIDRAQRYVLSKIAPVNPCGECRQCCKTLYINEDGLHKPSHQWCRHADGKAGCMIHWKRPKPCRRFECLWLESQRTDQPMADELRPDRSKVVLTHDTTDGDPELIEVHVDRETPDALSQAPIQSFLQGRKTKFITHYYGESL